MTRCTSSGLTRKPLNMSFGCAHTELKAITLASDHAHLRGGNGMPIHLEGVVKEPLADFGHGNNERMPIDEATESFARGIRRHRKGCLNGQPYFTDECIQREVASALRCLMTPPEVRGSSSTADGPPCQGVIGVQLAGNFSRGVQGRTSSSLMAREITFQVDRFKLPTTTATFPNAFSIGRMDPCTSTKTNYAPGTYFCQSNPAFYQIPRQLLGRLQCGLAGSLIGHGPLRSCDPLYINRQHAPLMSTAAPQVNRVCPPIYRQVDAVKRFWSNCYCHLSHSDCTQFDSAMSALWLQGRKTASRRDTGIQQRVSPGARLACAFGDGLDDAFERSELLNLRFSLSSTGPLQNHGGQKAASHRINDQVQFNIPMHHAHFAHPRLSTQLEESSCAVGWLPLRTARKIATSPTPSATFSHELQRPRLLAVDLLYRETHTDIQGLLQGRRIRQVRDFDSWPSVDLDGVHESTLSIRLPRFHRESDAKQRAIYVFLLYETPAHPTNPIGRTPRIVFLAQHAVNAVQRCQYPCRTGQILTIQLWIGRLRPGGRNDVIGNNLPLLKGLKARAGMEIDMPDNSYIVDLDLLKLPTRVALSYKLTRVGVPTNGKRDSSQTHTSLRRCLPAESAPGNETAQEGVLPIPICPRAVDGSIGSERFYRPLLQRRCDDAPVASRVTGDRDTNGVQLPGAPHDQLSGAGRATYQGADVGASEPLGLSFGLNHALAPCGRFKGSHVRTVRPKNMRDAPPIPTVMDCRYNYSVGVQFCPEGHSTDSVSLPSIVPIRRHTVTHAFSRPLLARLADSQFGETSNRPTQTSIERIHQILVLPTPGLVNHGKFPNFHVTHDSFTTFRLAGFNINVVAVASRYQRIKLQFLSHITLPLAPKIIEANRPTVNRKGGQARCQLWVGPGWHRRPGNSATDSAEISKKLHGIRTSGEAALCI